MAVYVIADLHLSTDADTNKPMEVFGQRWQDYTRRIEANWRRLVTDSDTVIVPGDVSWALSLEEALSDLRFIDSLPGRKLLGKGNHDFWWCTMKKHREFFEKHGITTIDFLYNNAHEVENLIVAGSRGWFHDEDATGVPDNSDFDKLVAREGLRLKMSLDEAMRLKERNPEREVVVFMHFPPHWSGKSCDNIIAVLKEYGIKRVYFGHIHGAYTVPESFEHEGILFTLISADYLEFIPKFIPQS
ncbi:MAG: metallophosphoesterase [Clostridia bacterium]|nr:metallophosphoesterase [Clostridia bacterium]